jgi:hypothetical protein
MTTHPYVRAYLAGIAVPTMFMLFVISAFVVARFVFQVPIPIERALIFPMALAPNLFGAWNMYYHRLHLSHTFSIGVHGAILPLFMAPIGYEIATHLGFLQLDPSGLVWFGDLRVSYALVATGFCIALIIYYLVWKHFVNFFNELLGIA